MFSTRRGLTRGLTMKYPGHTVHVEYIITLLVNKTVHSQFTQKDVYIISLEVKKSIEKKKHIFLHLKTMLPE